MSGEARKDTQNDKILHHLQLFGSITPIEALNSYSCFRLAARIADLRRRGVQIKAERETGADAFGNRVQFTRYSLIR